MKRITALFLGIVIIFTSCAERTASENDGFEEFEDFTGFEETSDSSEEYETEESGTEETTAVLADTSETSETPATTSPMPLLDGILVYDAALEDMPGYADPDNLPGCDWTGYQGEILSNGSGRLYSAGDAYVSHLDKGLYIYGRVNTWDSVDVCIGGLEPGDYTLQVKFSSNNPMWFAIENADAPWGALAATDYNYYYNSYYGYDYDYGYDGVTEAILIFDFTLNETGEWYDEDGNMQNRFRLNAIQGVDYYIENIRIYARQ